MNNFKSILFVGIFLLIPLQSSYAGYDSFTVNVPNSQGGYTALDIKKSGDGYTGPNGEYYSEFPTVSQLQAVYGLGTLNSTDVTDTNITSPVQDGVNAQESNPTVGVTLILIVAGFILWKCSNKKSQKLLPNGDLRMELKYTVADDLSDPIKCEIPKEAICPYCNYKFESMPKRSRKCPECKQYIYRQKNYDARIIELITEEQFKRKARISADKQWAEYNKEIEEFSKTRDWNSLSQTYYMMALQLWGEEKDFFQLLQESAKFKLYYERERGLKYVEISGGECAACKKQAGKVYLIEDALKEMPIPCKNCTFDLHGVITKSGWCRCLYIPNLKDF